MTKVLFENHHLYYLPNFIPIIDEMRQRGGYEIFTSIPSLMESQEKDIFYSACDKLNVETVIGSDENSALNKLIQLAFDVVVVGNVGS